MTRARDVANVLSTASDLATDTETAAAISSHNSSTTSVHGIADTATLATQTYVQSNKGINKGNTASRPSSPSNGDLYYNTETSVLEVYDGGWWIPNTTPGIPTSAVATNQPSGRAYNNGQASVAFSPATSGGKATSYTVTSLPGSYTTTGSSSPLVVNGLQSSTQYTYTVTATGPLGTSASSSASSGVTATTVPQAPTIGTATGADSSATLTFTAGATGGATISNYKYSSDGSTYTAFSPSQTASPLTISGLTNNQSYAFYLKAVNANGDSIASSQSNSVTPAVASSLYHIATTTVTSGSPSTITFSSIPNTYSHLMLVASVRSVGGVAGATGQGEWRLNLGTGGSVDTATNYTFQYLEGDTANSKNSSYNAAAGAFTMGLGWYQSGGLGGIYYNPQIIHIYDYTSTSKAKTITARNGYFPHINSGNTTIEYKTGAWKNTSSPVDIIQCYSYAGGDGVFADNSTISLYGVM